MEPVRIRYVTHSQTDSRMIAGLIRHKTANGVSRIIMAAACHPEAKSKVHDEIDAVVGRSRGVHYIYQRLH